MEFKIKFFDSAHLQDTEMRRVRKNFLGLRMFEFLSFLKNEYDIGEAETIFVFWKNDSQWTYLKSEEDWETFMKKIEEDASAVMKLHIYYGNVHINVTCDICGNVVIGDRYKCLQCDDFDICQICFQQKHSIHKEHCMLLLRTPQDSSKFLRSIPTNLPNGGADFRVLDLNFETFFRGMNLSPNTMETQTEVMESAKDSVKSEDVKESPGGSNDVIMGDGVGGSVQTEDTSLSQEDMDKLPPQIVEGLNHLRAMGFKNINGPLIALLIEKNGSVVDVIEELEYSLKK